jgi:RNA polymerase sigma-70 factor (ECF subfamily)
MAETRAQLEVVEVYDDTAEFVYKSLLRLGVAKADVEDVMQEVYVVVHRRLKAFKHDSKLSTWVFGICLKVAAQHRRRAYHRRERQMEVVPEGIEARTPEQLAHWRERQRRLELILEGLSPEHRAVFVMFEIEGISCQEIAEQTGIAVGTVYSRLHTARKQIQQRAAELLRAPLGGGES